MPTSTSLSANGQKGFAQILLILAALGVVGFLLIASSAQFNNKLFARLFPKSQSSAGGGSISNPVAPNPHVYTLEIDDAMDSVDGLTTITIVKKFFQEHPDKANFYDFVAIFPSFQPRKEYFANLGIVANNQVSGICLRAQTPDSQTWGSSRLQGVEIYLYDYVLNGGLLTYYGGNGSILLEETAHRWLAYVGKADGQSLGDSIGIPQSCRNTNLPLLLNGTSNWPHWSGGLQMPTTNYGAMREAKPWIDNGDGTYHYDTSLSTQPHKFHPFDLYLMGLMDPSEITGSYLLLSNINVLNKNSITPQNPNLVASASAQRITIQDIISVAGEPRNPPAGTSQKDFNLAFVILTKPGQIPPTSAVDTVNQAANDFPAQWAYATGNRSTINQAPTAGIPGDINGNGRVDIFDYNLLVTDFGCTSGTCLRSDLNGNGRVDIFDYNIVVTNFGRTI